MIREDALGRRALTICKTRGGTLASRKYDKVRQLRFYQAHITGQLVRRFRKLFPERQIFLRSRGEVRFLRLSPAFQAAAASVLLAVAGWLVVLSFNFLTGDIRLASKERELAHVSGELGTLLTELERLQNDALGRADRLEARQRLIDELVEVDELTVDMPAAQDQPEEIPDSDSDAVPAEHSYLLAPSEGRSLFAAFLGASSARAGNVPTAARISYRTGMLVDRLRRLEAEQERVAESLLMREEGQLEADIAVLARLGLGLDDLLGHPVKTGSLPGAGLGGPLFTLDGNLIADSFERLAGFLNLRRDFHRAIASVPSAIPAKNYYLSSHYGTRQDPFRKSWAMHSGVDLAGWPGEPILAAGGGRVVKAGRAPAYGMMVEIDHGNGFRTRYGHMRKLAVKAGDEVARGEKVGEMGSTGRSTSTHLHLEIWLHGRIVDPLPYLEASEDVFSIQRQGRVDEG